MAEIGVRLNGDNSGFRSMLDKSLQDATRFGGEITGKVGDKLGGMRDISTAVATALGINLKEIADNIARLFTGMSKEEEAAFKQLEKVSDELAETTKKNMLATLTDEQRYQVGLKEREKLLNDIANNDAKNGQQILKQKQDELALAKLSTELIAFEVKQREEAAKKAEAAFKTQVAAREKEYQASLLTLSADERINSLKEQIAAMEAVIVSGVLKTKDAEGLSAQLQERKNQLVSEEAKLQKDKAEIVAKNSAAEQDAMIKRDDSLRSEAKLDTQRKELLQEIAVTQQEVVDLTSQNLDATEKIRRVEVLRGQLKEVEKKQNDVNVEVAKLMLKGTENLNAEEKVRLQLLTGQVTQKQLDKEINELVAKAVTGQLLPAEKERLAVLVGQSEEIKHQLVGLIDMTNQAKIFVQTINSKGGSYADKTTVSLEGIRDRLKSQLDAVKAKNAISPHDQRDPMEFALQQEFDNVSRELNARKSVGNFFNQFGEDATRFRYGDTLTDQALRHLQDEQTKTRVTIEQILEQMKHSPFFGT